jgi:hypothetical protein
MAEAGVNIEVLYSDHNHQLILVVDDLARGLAVSEAWTRETDEHAPSGPGRPVVPPSARRAAPRTRSS